MSTDHAHSSDPNHAAAVLQRLHDHINAIGGVPANDYERGANDAIGQALAIIEAEQAKADAQ